MATGSPAKPWERNRSQPTGTRLPSSLGNTSTTSTQAQCPALPSRSSLSNPTLNRPMSTYGSSPYSSYGASPYSNTYGSTYNRYGSTGMYGGAGGYGSSMYGGASTYGSRYGAGSMYGGGYGASSYGAGSMYGSRYGSSMYGSRYGAGSMYGGGYGASSYGGYGSGYDDFRNPYPRGKYWSYGGSPEDGEPVDEFGNPIGPEGPGSWLMDMENVVEGFGHFTRILDYNFEAMHGSFASILRLFDSMSELRRAIYYGLQGLALFTFIGKALVALQKFLYKLLGKPIPDRLQISETQLASSLEDQWGSSGAVRLTPQHPKKKSNSRAVFLLLAFFAVILGGPMLVSALYRAFAGPAAQKAPRRVRPKIQVRALYDFMGENQDDLKFSKGEIITIRRKVSEGWLEGELPNGTVGLVPEPYVQPITPAPSANQPHTRSASMPGPHHAEFNEQDFLETQNPGF